MKILKPFLKPTADHKKFPTDIQLDNDMAYVSFILHKLAPTIKHIIKTKIKLFFLYRWKFLVGRIFIFGLVGYLLFLLITSVAHVKFVSDSEPTRDTIITQYRCDSTMNLRNYLLQIAYYESRYDPTAHRDSSQFWGLYQLGHDARKNGGYGDIPKDVFLNHPEIQDLCMVNLLKEEKKIMQPYIDKYEGKIIDGVLVTESGILALCHTGVGYAQSCLDKGVFPEVDEYGNHPRILIQLGGYKLNLDKVRYSIEDAN